MRSFLVADARASACSSVYRSISLGHSRGSNVEALPVGPRGETPIATNARREVPVNAPRRVIMVKDPDDYTSVGNLTPKH